MKALTTALFIFLSFQSSFSQDSVTICEIEDVFSASTFEYGERTILVREVNEVDTESCYADAINNNDQNFINDFKSKTIVYQS